MFRPKLQFRIEFGWPGSAKHANFSGFRGWPHRRGGGIWVHRCFGPRDLVEAEKLRRLAVNRKPCLNKRRGRDSNPPSWRKPTGRLAEANHLSKLTLSPIVASVLGVRSTHGKEGTIWQLP